MINQENLQGHWRRDWIKAPGFEDHTTRVHWMQSGETFVDLRVPLERPSIDGASCLADLSQPAVLELMKAEGFAGQISVQNSKCTWHRQINWHGAPEADDIGLMYFEDYALIEDGVLADYCERWLLVPTTEMQARRFSLEDQSGFLIETAVGFAIGIGPKPKGTSKHLQADLASNRATPQAIATQFAAFFAIGDWVGNAGVVSLSTNPFYEGHPILQQSGGGLLLRRPTFDGALCSQTLRIAYAAT